MISSWYLPYGFCFPFGSKYKCHHDITKRKERAIIHNIYLKKAYKIYIGIIVTKCNKMAYFTFLRYSYKNLKNKVYKNGKKKTKQKKQKEQ